MPQTVFDQLHAHTHVGSCAGIIEHTQTCTQTHTDTLKVADGCALHTGRTAGTVLGKGEGLLLPAKTKTKICSSQNKAVPFSHADLTSIYLAIN